MKIRINDGTRNDLKKLKGVGDKTADKIMRFREEGGRFHSLEEFQKVSGLRSDYLDAVKNDIDLGDEGESGASAGSGMSPIDPGMIDPGIIGPPVDIPELRRSYTFTVRVAGGSEDSEINPFAGYKLVVGYTVAQVGFNLPGQNDRDYSHAYDIPAEGEVTVRIDRPIMVGSFLRSAFDLLINAPDGAAVYERTLDIESGETVEVHVPRFVENVLVVQLEKQTTIAYSDYTLRIDFRINRAGGGVDTQRREFDIATRDEIRVEIGRYGDVLDLDARVLSPNGLTVVRTQADWDDIGAGDSDGLKTLPLTLPAPNSLSYEANLVPDPEELDNPFAEHTLTVAYQLKEPETDDPPRTVERNYSIDGTGTAYIDFEYYGRITEMIARVHAPSGEVIGQRELKPSEIGAEGEVRIHVQPRKLASVEGMETLPERPQKTVGRVIDAMGRRNYEDVQVILYATREPEPSDEDFAPIQVIRTEGQGYFQIDTPKGYFTDAFAYIGVAERGAVAPEPERVPIRLESDTVLVVRDNELEREDHLFFPGRMILVIGGAAQEDEEVDENNCGFLEFHRPKRVVDEFSFHTVVRTTEPDIQGYTLEEDGEMTVQDIVDTVSISPDSGDGGDASVPARFLRKSIRKNVLLKYINDKRGLTFTTLRKALNESDAQKLREKVKPQRRVRAQGRHALNLDNAIDWDEDPTIYQATSLAHGHLLQFKQEWINDGYSIGDLLYSLPLAPGQKKQIVTFDWERRESATRTGTREYQESLYNSLSRDRDVNEMVRGVFSERMRGGSTARTSSFGAGAGLGFIAGSVGGLLGVAGGSSKSSSTAWQNSSRNTSMSSMQQLHDRTVQSANAVRSQRSTVVTTATQGERFSAETESVANFNHCHSITIQYFEVLRHLKIRQRLAGVQECLFVPLILSPFDHQKILRWREAIRPFIQNPELERGFDAIERIENDYEGSDLPEERYADETIDSLEGELYLRIQIASPHKLTTIEDPDSVLNDVLDPIGFLLPGLEQKLRQVAEAAVERRNELFFENIAPVLAAAFVEKLRFQAIVQSGPDGNESLQDLPLDTTLVSDFENNGTHYISLRQSGDLGSLIRARVKGITVQKASQITLDSDGDQTLADAMPRNSRIIVTSGGMRYRTRHFSGHLFRDSRIMDDLVGYGGLSDDSEKVRIATPLTRREMRNPRNKDLERANELLGHLNDNLEQYHRLIWMNMSDERRFMLLDGIRVTDYSEAEDYPRGVIRSVASVVENRVIGVVGNSLIMPVAPGFRLSPRIQGQEVDLLSLYEPQSPPAPIHVSVPTKGVYAESVMGQCNSCEKKQEDRFWRWSEEPIPQDPTAIQPVGTESRRAAPMDTSPEEFPNPMVNIQNAPQAPQPAGVGAAADLLGKSSFENITGLDRNQANALQALQSSLQTAQAFGSEAAKLSALGRKLQAIKEAKENNMLSEDKAREMTEKAITDSGAAAPDSLESGLSSIGKVQDMVQKGEIPGDVGRKLTDAIGNGMGKAVGNGAQSLEDLINSGGEKIGEGKVHSVEAENRNPDGSSSKVSLTGGGKQASSEINPEEALSNLEGKFGEVLRIYFDKDKAELKEAGDQKLENFVTALRDSVLLSTRQSPYRIKAYGLASKEGTAEHNQVLSERRASTVKERIESLLGDQNMDRNQWPVEARGLGEGFRNPPDYPKDRVVILFAETIPFIRAQGGIVEHMRGTDQSVREFVHERLKARDPIMMEAAEEANLIVLIKKMGGLIIPIPDFTTAEEIEEELAEETLRLYKEKIDQRQEEGESGMWRELPPALRNLG